jgi:hypothetical protein
MYETAGFNSMEQVQVVYMHGASVQYRPLAKGPRDTGQETEMAQEVELVKDGRQEVQKYDRRCSTWNTPIEGRRIEHRG